MKVLFVAANPLDTGRLALDEEMRAIERKVAGSPFAARMKFAAAWAARPDDLLQAVNEHRPTVIHFAGHASASALELVSDAGRGQADVERSHPVAHQPGISSRGQGGLNTDMDEMAINGWEMVNGSWYPGGTEANMMAVVFWRRRVGPPPGGAADDGTDDGREAPLSSSTSRRLYSVL